jgi:deferrochelatase/peroxidase EfeB
MAEPPICGVCRAISSSSSTSIRTSRSGPAIAPIGALGSADPSAPGVWLVTEDFDPQELQGNILRGYRRKMVRYLMLQVCSRAAAQAFLASIVAPAAPGLAITTEAQWETKPDYGFNIGVTFEGLRALGAPTASLASFPCEFAAGMTARARKLGDYGESAPATWPTPFDRPDLIHIVAAIYADDAVHLDAVERQVMQPAHGMNLLGTRDGANFDGDYVHFGYRDNISQPRFAEVRDRPTRAEPLAPLGTLLLGHPTTFDGLRWRVPQPDSLGLNGCFSAFRILAQDCEAFEAYLDKAALGLSAHPRITELLAPGAEARFGAHVTRHDALREVVAAHLCGRWRNGTPLALSPDTPNPEPPVSLTDFDYPPGSRCPAGAHVRRTNPRGAKIVQRVENHSRRLVRRGMPYGPAYDPASPDAVERGLLGNFLGANLGTQFEAITCDWLNVGLQDPDITGANDPLLGANNAATSWFDIPLPAGGAISLRGFPRFVRTRGGAYVFLPTLPAIRHLASLR